MIKTFVLAFVIVAALAEESKPVNDLKSDDSFGLGYAGYYNPYVYSRLNPSSRSYNYPYNYNFNNYYPPNYNYGSYYPNRPGYNYYNFNNLYGVGVDCGYEFSNSRLC